MTVILLIIRNLYLLPVIIKYSSFKQKTFKSRKHTSWHLHDSFIRGHCTSTEKSGIGREPRMRFQCCHFTSYNLLSQTVWGQCKMKYIAIAVYGNYIRLENKKFKLCSHEMSSAHHMICNLCWSTCDTYFYILLPEY